MVRFAILAVLLATGFSGVFAQTDFTAAYVDSKVCATCHREIAAKYARTGMGRSFYKPARPETTEEFYHALSDSHYRMTVRNGDYFQKRWQIGPDGNEMNVEELKIDYVIGSGNHGRFYLHRTEQGMLIELPLGWYPEKGGRWGMVPGSDLPQPFRAKWVRELIWTRRGTPTRIVSTDASLLSNLRQTKYGSRPNL